MREEEVGGRREKTQGFFLRQRTHFPRPASSLLLALLPWRPPGHTTIPRGTGHGRGKPDLAGDLHAAGGLPPMHFFQSTVPMLYDGATSTELTDSESASGKIQS